MYHTQFCERTQARRGQVNVCDISNMRRLRVLFITTWHPTRDRPWAVPFIREHAKAVRLYDDVVVLDRAGPDPNLKTLWRMEEETNTSIAEGIPTYRLWHKPLSNPVATYLAYAWSVLQGFRSLRHQGFTPDIIHAHVFVAGLPAVLIGKLYGIPVVVTEHYTGFPKKVLTKLDVWRARIAFRWANVVMPVSTSLQQAIQAYGIKAHFQVVPNVVDTKLFHPDPSPRPEGQPKRLLLVGLLDDSHRKGVPYLLKALAQLKQHRDDWHLDIVGEGPARGQYEGMAADLGIANRVTFHGPRPRSEVARLMSQADIFVVSSLVETFSVVAAEALASGTPVLTTRCGGPEEFVTDDVGKVIPPGDSTALYKGLAYLLDHLKRFSSGQLSRYASERFSPEQVGNVFHAIYEKSVLTHRD